MSVPATRKPATKIENALRKNGNWVDAGTRARIARFAKSENVRASRDAQNFRLFSDSADS
jgi:hypothetical protein